MDFFEQQWSSYRAIVQHNLMEHREVAEATSAAIESWWKARPSGAPAPTMLDLGCGDLALLPPMLRQLPLASYTGLDLAAVVLPLAKAALGPVSYQTNWLQGDLLAWAQGDLGDSTNAGRLETSQPPAIIHSAFAIHHLSEEQKLTFLQAARERIQPDGVFIWTDIFREPGESRQHYVERYRQRIHSSWLALTQEQQEHVIAHLSSFDLPADRDVIRGDAQAAGWSWRWQWQGTHHAEATAVLTPLTPA